MTNNPPSSNSPPVKYMRSPAGEISRLPSLPGIDETRRTRRYASSRESTTGASFFSGFSDFSGLSDFSALSLFSATSVFSSSGLSAFSLASVFSAVSVLSAFAFPRGLRFFAASAASLKYLSSSNFGRPSSDLSKKTIHTSTSSFVRSETKLRMRLSADQRGEPSLSGWRVTLNGSVDPSAGAIKISLLKSRSELVKESHRLSGLQRKSISGSQPSRTVRTSRDARSIIMMSPRPRRNARLFPSGEGLD